MSDDIIEPPFPVSLILACTIQAALGLFMLLVPFGFDKVGRGELDFDYLVLAVALYLLSLLYGVTLAAWHRKWAFASSQALGLVIVVALFYFGFRATS
jgi:hypothetical protein